MRQGYFPLDANPVFICHGGRAPPAHETQPFPIIIIMMIIIIIIIIIISSSSSSSSIVVIIIIIIINIIIIIIIFIIINIIIIIIIIIIINERLGMKVKRKFKPSSLKICLYLFINRRKYRSVFILESV